MHQTVEAAFIIALKFQFECEYQMQCMKLWTVIKFAFTPRDKKMFDQPEKAIVVIARSNARRATQND